MLATARQRNPSPGTAFPSVHATRNGALILELHASAQHEEIPLEKFFILELMDPAGM